MNNILYIILLLLISTSAYVLGDLYTKKQIDDLIYFASESPYYWQVRERGPAVLRENKMTPLTIERLLYFNSIAVDGWGKINESDYKDWVKK